MEPSVQCSMDKTGSESEFVWESEEHQSTPGFRDARAEREDENVRCPVCKEVVEASHAERAFDFYTRDDEGVVASTRRYYVCSSDCAIDLMFQKDLLDEL